MDCSGPGDCSTFDGIIDCRDREAFERGHIPGSLWLPWPALKGLQNALPPPGARLLLIEALDEAVDWLLTKGYRIVSRPLQAGEGTEAGMHQGMLFRPSPPLEEMLARWPRCGRALDMGCGGGRDAIWLAQRGWLVTAIDRERRALEKGMRLASLYGLCLDWRCCNLRDEACLPAGRFDLMLMMRFVVPERFEWMRRHLRPGGRVVVWAFHEAAEHPARPHLKTTPEKLAAAFDGLATITAKITEIEDGRPMALYIGEKR